MVCVARSKPEDPSVDGDSFHSLARFPTSLGTRRRALTALGGVLGLALGTSSVNEAGAKRKKKKRKEKTTPTTCTCPPTSAPPPAPLCAGKNTCAGTDPSGCHKPGANSLCLCWARADDTTTFCGSLLTGSGSSCSVCTEENETCVVLGGECGGGFGCATPCPNPQ
jgi:hypothetical protein